MTWEEGSLSRGAPQFYRNIIDRAVANGWARFEDIDDRGVLAAAPDVMSTTPPIDLNVTGIAVGTWIDLPVMYLGSFVAQKNFVTPVVEGVDYDIRRGRGQIRLRAGGLFDNGAGSGTGHFTLNQNYTLKRGWTILKSLGVSGAEAIYLGLRFDSLNGSAAYPVRAGIRWTCFSTWTVGATDYDSTNRTIRNAAVDDVLQYIFPNLDFEWAGTFTLDRITCMGYSGGLTAWCAVGAMTRFRPTTEQALVTAMVGNCAGSNVPADGCVGNTADGGTMSSNRGSCWLYDFGVFADATNPVEMNANHCTFEAGSTVFGYTPSLRLLNTPGPSGSPQYYFELHDVITGWNINVANDARNILYGLWDGLHMCLVAFPIRNQEISLAGVIYRLWNQGDSSSRFVAVRKT